jgi:phage terminase small subunit
MARPPKPPAYLDEFAAQQWKAKAKQLAERGDLTPADWNNLELIASTTRCTAKPWKTLPRGDSA